jgi:hypothetical protein
MPTLESIPYEIFPLFTKHLGDNHAQVERVEWVHSGPVYFRQNIGAKLHEQLYYTCAALLHCNSIRIYHEDECQWTDGPRRPAVHIQIDDDGLVQDFEYWPDMPYHKGNPGPRDEPRPKAPVVKETESGIAFVVHEEIGDTIMYAPPSQEEKGGGKIS